MIEPENEETLKKYSIFIENDPRNSPVRKKKRRFVYYLLCMLLSFVISRAALIIFSIASFDLKNYAFNEVRYTTERAKSVYLEASTYNAYSPLNAQILEGVVSLYYNTKDSNTRELMAQIHVPLIHVEKYKTLQFKGNLVWKNLRPKIIYKLIRDKGDVSVYFAGNIWFRFCFIKFWKSHSSEIKLNYPADFISENKKDSFSVHAKEIRTENLDDRLQIELELETCKLRLPDFLNVQTNDILLNFMNDLPFKVKMLNQEIVNGKLMNPIIFRLEVFKKDFFIYRSSIFKAMNNQPLLWSLNSLDISAENQDIEESFDINIADWIRHSTEKSTNPISNYPKFSVSNIEIIGSTIKGNLTIDICLFPYITNRTKFKFKECIKNFILQQEQKKLATISFELLEKEEFLKIKWKIMFFDINNLPKLLTKEITNLNLVDDNSKGLFEGESLNWDGKKLSYYHERNQTLLYTCKESKKPFHAEIDHHLSSNEKEIKLSSSYLSTKKNENLSPLIEIIIPKLDIEIFDYEKKLYHLNSTLVETKCLMFDDCSFDAFLHFDTLFNLKKDLFDLNKLKSLASEQMTIKINKSKEITFKYKGTTDSQASDNNDPIFDLEKLEIEVKKIISLDPFRVGLSVKNPLEIGNTGNYNMFICNRFTVKRGPHIRLIFPGAEYTDNEHVKLLKDMKCEVNYIDGNFKFGIDECYLGLGLYSSQELRILILDFFKFGESTNKLGNAVSMLFKNLMENTDKDFDAPVVVKRIASSCKVNLEIKSDGFSDYATTDLSFKIGLSREIISSSRIRKFNFDHTSFVYYKPDLKTQLARFDISIDSSDKSYIYLVGNISFTRKLVSEYQYGILTCNNLANKTAIENRKKDLTRDGLLNVIRSFFVNLWSKEKEKAHIKSILTSLIVDASKAKITLKDKIMADKVLLAVENYGIRDFIRYNFGILLSKIFKFVPDNLSLELKASRIDLAAMYDISFPGSYHFQTSILDVSCSQNFEMGVQIPYPKSDELNPEVVKKYYPENILFSEDKIFNDNSTDLSLDDKNKQLIPAQDSTKDLNPKCLVYGTSNAYALVISFRVETQLSAAGVEYFIEVAIPKSRFIETLFEFIKEVDNPLEEKISKASAGIDGFSFVLGFNLFAKCPPNIDLFIAEHAFKMKEDGLCYYYRTVNGVLTWPFTFSKESIRFFLNTVNLKIWQDENTLEIRLTDKENENNTITLKFITNMLCLSNTLLKFGAWIKSGIYKSGSWIANLVSSRIPSNWFADAS
ncbi:uncharacterized protein VNE69_03025 [Vairimorpha necatrix]|uniref:Membrane protein n=1 Tax=Vairimorpha necatrix TaxID=6039 RepID=A0AAX4J9X5_9MICR